MHCHHLINLQKQKLSISLKKLLKMKMKIHPEKTEESAALQAELWVS